MASTFSEIEGINIKEIRDLTEEEMVTIAETQRKNEVLN